MRMSQSRWLAAPALCLCLVLAGCSHVADDWKQAQAANTTESYQEFLRQHPDSEFSKDAHDKLAQLAEERDWELAVNAGTLDAYQQFLAAHADGKWAQEARVRIESIQMASTPGGEAAAAPGALPGEAGATTAVPPLAAAAPAGAAPKPAPVAAAPAAPKSGSTQPGSTQSGTSKPAPHKPATVASARPKASRAAGAHLVQLGAYGSRASAVAAWEKASARFPSQLGSMQPRYATGTSHGKPIVRLQLRVATRQQAQSICSQLKKQKQACVVAG